MALKTPYATIAQADVYLSSNSDWLLLTDDQKNEKLENARYYIDLKYSCSVEVDMDDIPEEYVKANSLLAGYDTTDSIFLVDNTGGNSIVKKRVKAGQVESETTYAGERTTSVMLDSIDKYPLVTALLSEYCSRIKSNGVKTLNLLRA